VFDILQGVSFTVAMSTAAAIRRFADEGRRDLQFQDPKTKTAQNYSRHLVQQNL
jgi:hypothetical protein